MYSCLVGQCAIFRVHLKFSYSFLFQIAARGGRPSLLRFSAWRGADGACTFHTFGVNARLVCSRRPTSTVGFGSKFSFLSVCFVRFRIQDHEKCFCVDFSSVARITVDAGGVEMRDIGTFIVVRFLVLRPRTNRGLLFVYNYADKPAFGLVEE